MTFEEFFKKKKIDLAALEKADGSLFAEFKTHFEQMGEKSFDHTKKYWFNKLRRQYVLVPEVKTEKIHIANPLAEQTITESLSEAVAPTPPSPKLGFVPKFKMGNMAKPAVNIEGKKEEGATAPLPAEDKPVADDPTPTPSKLGFIPKFKMGNMAKPAINAGEKKEEAAALPLIEDKPITSVVENPTPTLPVETNAAKPAYKPRFNMKSIPPKPPEE